MCKENLNLKLILNRLKSLVRVPQALHKKYKTNFVSVELDLVYVNEKKEIFLWVELEVVYGEYKI